MLLLDVEYYHSHVLFELYGTLVFSSDVKIIVFGKKRQTANYMLCATHFFIYVAWFLRLQASIYVKN